MMTLMLYVMAAAGGPSTCSIICFSTSTRSNDLHADRQIAQENRGETRGKTNKVHLYMKQHTQTHIKQKLFTLKHATLIPIETLSAGRAGVCVCLLSHRGAPRPAAVS
jgi:hypothetical protein